MDQNQQTNQPGGPQPSQPAPTPPFSSSNTPFASPSSPVISQPSTPLTPNPSAASQPFAPPPPPPSQAVDEQPKDENSYESNPFLNTIRGLIQVLRYDPVTSILSGIIIVPPYILSVALILILGGHAIALVIAILILAPLWFIFLFLLTGLWFSIAAASIDQKTISFKTGWKTSAGKFFPFLGLSLLCGIAIYIGFLFLIVPGVILMARLSLAPLVMFKENLGPIDSIKRSFTLTNGHSFEMLGSIVAGYLFSGGFLLAPAVTVAPLVGRYEDIKRLNDTKAPKPKTHWLNYLCVALPVIFIAGYTVLVIVLVIVGFHNSNNNGIQNYNGGSLNITSPTPSATPSTFGSNNVSVDENAAPYCGALPTSSMSPAAIMYLNATIAENVQKSVISKSISATNTITATDINQTLVNDHEFLQSMSVVPFTVGSINDATKLENDVKNYDTLITTESTQLPNVSSATQSAIETARTARSNDGAALRVDLGLPQSTCSFDTP